jgi:hypothetical protein
VRAAAQLLLKEPGGQPQGAQAQQFDPRPLIEYVDQKLGTFQQHVNSQQQQQVNDVLAKWPADKPHYERVRRMMGQLIQTGVVPLKDGSVDLDGAYEVAVRMDPELHNQIISERVAGDRRALSERAQKAKRAGVSMAPSSPGAGASAAAAKRPKGRSVRESLYDAIDEHRG